MKKTILGVSLLCILNAYAFASDAILTPYNYGMYNIVLPTAPADSNNYVNYSITFCLKSDPNCWRGPSHQNDGGFSDPDFAKNPTFTTGCVALNTIIHGQSLAGTALLENDSVIYNLFIQTKTSSSATEITSFFIQDLTRTNDTNPPIFSSNPITCNTTTLRCEYNTPQTAGGMPTLFLNGVDANTCKASKTHPTAAPSMQDPYPGFD